MKISRTHHKTKTGVFKKNPPKKMVKVAFYKWGEFYSMEEVAISDLKKMTLLDEHDLLGFTLREVDEEKQFFAEDNDIEYSEDEGTGVKRSYGVNVTW